MAKTLTEAKKDLMDIVAKHAFDGFGEAVGNIKESYFDLDKDWKVEVEMDKITADVEDVLTKMLRSFVAAEVLAKDKGYPHTEGSMVLGRHAVEKLAGLVSGKATREYDEYILHTAKVLLNVVMYTMFSRFGGESDDA